MRCGTARHTIELGCQFVETGMNIVEFFTRERSLSRQHVLALVFAIVPPRALAAVRRVRLGRRVRPADTAVTYFFTVSLPHRSAVRAVALFDEVVEPLSDRHAGATCRVVGGFACF